MNGNNITEDYISLVPIQNGSKFLFSPYDYSGDSEDYKEFESMYAGMKMKLIVAKSYIPSISSCYSNSYDDIKDVNVYDLKDAFLIELPMFSGMESPILYIEL